jgi:hypothetical protein
MSACAWFWTICGMQGERGGWQPTAERARKAAAKALRELGRSGHRWVAGDGLALRWDRIDVERFGRGEARDKAGNAVALVWIGGRPAPIGGAS